MTQRSIPAGKNETIIIKTGSHATVRVHEEERAVAESASAWGLSIERRSAAEVARARLAIGEHTLLDLHFKKPALDPEKAAQEVIEIQVGGSGTVWVPAGSNVKVYAGTGIEVSGVQGRVDAYAGTHLTLQGVGQLGNASAGGAMDLDCETMLGSKVEFKCGRDLRFHVHDLTSAHLRIKDLGGYWEARIGAGEKSVFLKCGGDVTLVTDQEVEPLPPHFVLGRIEKPS